jgi:hypothetical protein
MNDRTSFENPAMPSPFPGMDPYLESAGRFPGLHNSLAAEIAGVLDQVLPEPYYAKVDIRLELGIAGSPSPRVRMPDVSAARDPWVTSEGGVATIPAPDVRTTISPYVEFHVETELFEAAFVEIRDPKSDHDLVTLIEILSPSNKSFGKDRPEYLAKRLSILNSAAPLIEIDLLRGGGDRVWHEPNDGDALANLAPPPPIWSPSIAAGNGPGRLVARTKSFRSGSGRCRR